MRNILKGGKRGFTLIELLVVIAIIGILAGILLATVFGVQKKANIKKCQANLREFFTAHQLYLDDFGAVPQFRWGKATYVQFVCAKIMDVKQCFCPTAAIGVGSTADAGPLGEVFFAGGALAVQDPKAYGPIDGGHPAASGISYAGRNQESPMVTNPVNPASTVCAMCDPTQNGDRHGGKSVICFFDGHTETTDYTNSIGAGGTTQHGPTKANLTVLTNSSGF
ncbi:MAG: prepilin-type N-terminal cleavage/methylation domain-containing protein [Planctomycetes bacterium]|nr:prepilin-type N-terminal cleavage/methylation domain-containing protein [Planctomycetota bacterium]